MTIKKKEKTVHGRPTKYREEFDEMLIEHMTNGYSFESFAGVIEVNQDTLHEWSKKHASFSESKKIAFAKCQVFWEKMGINGLMNNPKGATLNTANWIFNMKNRFKWTDKVHVVSEEKEPIQLAYDPTNLE